MRYIRIDKSNWKLIKEQRGQLYFCAVSITMATTTLKFIQLKIATAKEKIAQW